MASRMSWVIKEGRFTPYLPWMAVTILDRDRSKQSTPDRDLITPRSWWNVDCFPWNRTKENQRRRFKVKEATPGVVLPLSPGAWCLVLNWTFEQKNWSAFALHPILTEAPSSELAGCKTSGKAAWKRQNTKTNIKSLARLDLRAIGIFPFWVVLSFFNPIWRLLSFFYPRAHSRGAAAAETYFFRLQIGELMWNKRKCGASCTSEISTEWEPSFKIIFRVRLRLSKWLQFLSFW